MTKGIPEKAVDEAVGLDPVIHEGADITESGHSELGVVTRSKRRMYVKGSHHKKNGKIWEKFPNRLDPPPIGNFRLF